MSEKELSGVNATHFCGWDAHISQRSFESPFVFGRYKPVKLIRHHQRSKFKWSHSPNRPKSHQPSLSPPNVPGCSWDLRSPSVSAPKVHFSDEQILACAERARLQELLQRFESLEAEADWETAPWPRDPRDPRDPRAGRDLA